MHLPKRSPCLYMPLASTTVVLYYNSKLTDAPTCLYMPPASTTVVAGLLACHTWQNATYEQAQLFRHSDQVLKATLLHRNNQHAC